MTTYKPVDISGLDKAEILCKLYKGSKRQGMGLFDVAGLYELTMEEACELLSEHTYFDYLHGRVLKIDLSTDLLDTSLYNRDIGINAAEKIIAEIKYKNSLPRLYYPLAVKMIKNIIEDAYKNGHHGFMLCDRTDFEELSNIKDPFSASGWMIQRRVKPDELLKIVGLDENSI
jgi:hypothetical protein